MPDTFTRVYELQVKLAQDSLRQLSALRQSASGVESSLASLRTAAVGLGSVFGTALSVGAVIHGFNRMVDSLDDLGEAAQKTGTSVGWLSQMRHAANTAGVGAEALDTALVKLNRSLAGFDEEGSKSAQKLRDLGITSTDAQTAMDQLADHFAQMEDGAKKTALAVEIFGRSGADMIPVLNKGSEGLRELRSQMTAVSEESVRAADQFKDSMAEFSAQAQSFGISVANQVLPSLNSILDTMKQFRRIKDEGGIAGALLSGAQVREPLEALRELDPKIERLRIQLRELQDISAKGGIRAWFISGDISQAEKQLALLEKQRDLLRKIASEQIRELPTLAEAPGTPRPQPPPGKSPEQLAAEIALAERLKQDSLKGTIYLLEQYDEAQERADEATRNAALASKSHTQQLAEEKAANEAYLKSLITTPIDERTRALDTLSDALERGAITEEQFNDAWRRIATKTTPEVKDNLEGIDKLFDELGSRVDGYGKDISGALIDFATRSADAKLSFSDFVGTVLRDIAQMVTQMLVVQPLLDKIRDTIKSMRESKGGGGAGSNLFGSLASTALSFFFSEHGNVISAGRLIPMAQGGVIARPTIFPMASGMGLMGEAGPEAVLPLARTATGDLGVKSQGAGVTVNVINQSSADVAVESSRDAQGGTKIDVLVRRAVAENFARGHFDALMSSTFGISRRGH